MSKTYDFSKFEGAQDVSLSDTAFLDLAEKIGRALNNNRAEEDRLRAAGKSDEVNKIYLANKEAARSIFQSAGIPAAEFDKRMSKLGRSVGRRPNVKMANLFG